MHMLPLLSVFNNIQSTMIYGIKRTLSSLCTVMLAAFVCIQYTQAQEKETPRHWKIELAGALNNYSAWEVEPSVTYMPLRYAGIGMGILFSRVTDGSGFSGTSQDGTLRWCSTDNKELHSFFALRPSLTFQSPCITLGEDKDYTLYLSLSPGLTLPLPANRSVDVNYIPNHEGTWTPLKTERFHNKGGASVFYHVKTAVAFELDETIVFSAGYTFSTYDPYDGLRHISVEGKELNPKKQRYMHSFFISAGVRF